MKTFLEYSQSHIKSIQEVLTLFDVDDAVSATIDDISGLLDEIKSKMESEPKYDSDSEDYDEDEKLDYIEQEGVKDGKNAKIPSIKTEKDLDEVLKNAHTKNCDGFINTEKYLKENPDVKKVGQKPYYPTWSTMIYTPDKFSEICGVFSYSEKFDDDKLPEDTLYIFNIELLKGYGLPFMESIISFVSDTAEKAKKSKLLMKIPESSKNASAEENDARKNLIDLITHKKIGFKLQEDSKEMYEKEIVPKKDKASKKDMTVK